MIIRKPGERFYFENILLEVRKAYNCDGCYFNSERTRRTFCCNPYVHKKVMDVCGDCFENGRLIFVEVKYE